MTADNSDFHDGLAGVLGIDRMAPDASGKLILWAWAAMRVLDHLRSLPEIDSRRIAVAGHSRLAKAALLAAGLGIGIPAVRWFLRYQKKQKQQKPAAQPAA